MGPRQTENEAMAADIESERRRERWTLVESLTRGLKQAAYPADEKGMGWNLALASRITTSGAKQGLGRLSVLLIGCLLAAALSASTARAAVHVPGLVELDKDAYTVSETAGYLHITLVRTNPVGDEWVRYGIRRNDAVPGQDFDTIPNSLAHFVDGQTTYDIPMRVYNQGINTSAVVHAVVYTFGSYPQRLGPRHQARITILRNAPLDTRDPLNPLGLPATPNGNVLYNAPFYIAGRDSEAGRAAAHTRNARKRAQLEVIANSPGSRRIWFWNQPDPRSLVSKYLQWTQHVQPGSVVQLSTYSLVHGGCGYTANAGFAKRYQHWVDRLADGIGNFKVVMYLEVDSLITSGCLNGTQRHIRLVDELGYAIQRLERQPHVVVYVDAGAADAINAKTTARWLSQAGIKQANGFFVNATHFDWTSREIYYGQQISKRLGGVHFVVDTHGGGRGPLAPPDRVHHGNEVLCNPSGRGLGPLGTSTGYMWVDAFSWFDSPGRSGGKCVPGAPGTAVFWPAYAIRLVANRVSHVTGPYFPVVLQNGLVAKDPRRKHQKRH
jgi:endoglucanase